MKSTDCSANNFLKTTIGVLSHLISTIAFFILFIGLINEQAQADAFFQRTDDFRVPGNIGNAASGIDKLANSLNIEGSNFVEVFESFLQRSVNYTFRKDAPELAIPSARIIQSAKFNQAKKFQKIRVNLPVLGDDHKSYKYYEFTIYVSQEYVPGVSFKLLSNYEYDLYVKPVIWAYVKLASPEKPILTYSILNFYHDGSGSSVLKINPAFGAYGKQSSISQYNIDKYFGDTFDIIKELLNDKIFSK